jgi:glycosyltransferase
MRVSIVTVCFNSERTIGAALASVARQNYANIEHLVVDGGSLDGTLKVVETQGQRVSRMLTGPDSGIYDAMNKGVAAASGDLIGFLNSDDMFAGPSAIASIVQAMESERADAAYGDIVYVSAADPGKSVRTWRSGEFRRSRLQFGWMPPHPTFYARRSLVERVGGFDVRLRIAADYDFMLRCLWGQACTAAYVPEVLVQMRTGGASNKSLRALFRKSREDLQVLRRNQVGGVGSLLAKNLRKLPQFFV